jgi:hypothetical protein
VIETNSVGRPAFLPEYQGDIDWRRVGGQGQPGLRTTVGGFYKHWIPSSIHHTRFPGAAIDRASRSGVPPLRKQWRLLANRDYVHTLFPSSRLKFQRGGPTRNLSPLACLEPDCLTLDSAKVFPRLR